MQGEVIAVGDELTSGERLDTNSRWISQRLGELGVDVRFHSTVGDFLADDIAVLQAAIQRADLVVCTGGLGPTADDLTREAVAAAIGVELVRDQEALEHIRNLFTSRGREMPERNARQAEFPRGARVIFNPNGTAPGIDLTVPREGRPPCRLFFLPGVPAEMQEMWRATVAPAVAAALPEPRVIRHRCLKCFGVGESQFEAMLPDLIQRGREPRVGITASGATITLRVTAAAASEAAALESMEPTLATIREKLGVLVFGEEEDELQHAVGRLLRGQGASVATVETWTGGLVAHWLATACPDSLASGRLQLDAGESAEQLLQRAEEVRQEVDADIGLAVGSPLGDETPIVTIALATAGGATTKDYALVGHPSIHQPRVAKLALNRLRLHLLNHAE